MRYPRAALPALLALLAACVVDVPDAPGPRTVEVAVDPSLLATFELALPDDLRLALAWTGGEPAEDDTGLTDELIVVTDDVPLDPQTLTGSLTFEPDLLAREWLTPLETLDFAGEGQAVGYRPRLVLYEDVDGSGRFEPPVFDVAGADRVLAVDQAVSVAGLLDLERFLETQRPVVAELLYQATDDRFAPFVPVVEAGQGLLEVVELIGPVPLTAGMPVLATADLACHRALDTWAVRVYYPWSVPAVALHVDESLDAVAACGLVTDCVKEDLDALAAPDVRMQATPETLRIAQCRRNDAVESLVVHQAEVVCEDCTCRTGGVSEAWLVPAGGGPAWWPCGDSVDYCDRAGSLARVDPECFEGE